MRLLSLNDVVMRTSLSRACLYRLMRQGDFPKSTRISVRRVGWLEDEIDNWIMRFFKPMPTALGGE